MQLRQKPLSILCSAGMILAMLSACSSATPAADGSKPPQSAQPDSSQAAPQAVSQEGPDHRDETVSGRVTAIDGSSITIELFGNRRDPGGKGARGADAKPPEGKSGGDGSRGEAPKDMKAPPDDGKKPERDDKNSPEGNGGPGERGAGESINFTVSENAVIAAESEDGTAETGSLDAIQVGAMLQVTFDSDGAATSLLVKQVPQGRPEAPSEAPSDASAASEAESSSASA